MKSENECLHQRSSDMISDISQPKEGHDFRILGFLIIN